MSNQACFRIAIKALSKNKLQTGLTMLGLMIGVATVLTMFALGSGAQVAIESQVKAAGMNLIIVSSGNHFGTVEDDTQKQGAQESEEVPDLATLEAAPPSDEPKSAIVTIIPKDEPAKPADAAVAPVPVQEEKKVEKESAAARLGDPEAGLGVPATLALSDATAIRAIPGVQYVSEGVHTNVHLVAGPRRVFTRLHGDDTSLQFIRRAWKFDHGRFFSQDEQDKAAQVMVLGSVAAEKMFEKENPVGKTVTLWNQTFKVVGVAASSSWLVQAKKDDDQFDAVYVPFTTIHRLLDINTISDIALTVAEAGEVTRTTKVVTALLRQRHHIQPPDQRDDFTVTSQARKALSAGGMRREMAQAVTGNMGVQDKVTLEQMSKTLQRASSTMTALLASVAAVSLLVGGIGIMNIMLLSVTERTREIGIRRAIGARRVDVMRQFLMEAATLSVFGGLAGVILGIVSSVFITRWAAWSTTISPISIVLAFGAAASVGIFFGYYPARQASEVAPMESLRYE